MKFTASLANVLNTRRLSIKISVDEFSVNTCNDRGKNAVRYRVFDGGKQQTRNARFEKSVLGPILQVKATVEHPTHIFGVENVEKTYTCIV